MEDDEGSNSNSVKGKLKANIEDSDEMSEDEVDSEDEDETIARIQRAHYAQAAAMSARRRSAPRPRAMSAKRKMEAIRNFHDFTKKLKKDAGITIRSLGGNNILDLDYSSEESQSDSDGLSEEEFVVNPSAVQELTEENESYIDPETGDFVEGKKKVSNNDKQPSPKPEPEPKKDEEPKTLSISDIINDGDLDLTKNVEIAEVEQGDLCTEKPEEMMDVKEEQQDENSEDFDITEKLKEMGEISVKPVKKEDEEVDKEEGTETEDEKKAANPGALNVRRNIRDVMDEKNLDASTLAAQRQESERLARVQEQQRIIREVQRQIAMNKQNKIHQKTLALLTGGSSILKHSSQNRLNLSNTVLTKLPAGEAKKTILKQGQLEVTKVTKPTTSLTALKADQKPEKKEVVEIVSSSSGDEESSSSSDSDDCIMLSDSEVPPSPEAEDDPNNSGLHVNDAYNTPDEQGRVLINIGHPENEEDIFLAPQIARIIKPHQIGGVRFLFDNIIESVERFSTSTGFGCILAHSMGLGKTLQIVCFCDIFLRHTTSKTVLCIMPINTLQNWVAEFNMWLPVDASRSPLSAQGEVRSRNFPIYVLNDSHKTLQMRARVVKDWTTTGGVLMIGYELYRLLSMKKDKKPRKKRKDAKSEVEKEKEKKDKDGEKPEAANDDTQGSDNTMQSKISDESKQDKEDGDVTKPDDVKDEKKEDSPVDEEKKLLDEMYEALVKPGPDLVICDEGHRIKNSHSNISYALKQMRTKRRVVLTGYPLQNNLLEYWCMVDFVRPNYLGSKTEFCNMFERPIQNGQCIDSTPQDIRLMRYRAHVLHSLLVGFVQRRSHAVLQSTLPQKEEYVLLIRMTPLQRKLYDQFMNEVVRSTSVPNPLKAFAICCKIWNHPDVLYNFLRKRSEANAAIEEDLDLEELRGVTKARNKNGKVPAKRGPKPRGASKKPAATIPPNTTTVSGVSRQDPSYGNSQYPPHGPSGPGPYPYNYQNPQGGYQYPPNPNQGYNQNYDQNYYNQQQQYGNNYPNNYPQNPEWNYNQNWGNSNYYGNNYYNNQYPNGQPPNYNQQQYPPGYTPPTDPNYQGNAVQPFNSQEGYQRPPYQPPYGQGYPEYNNTPGSSYANNQQGPPFQNHPGPSFNGNQPPFPANSQGQVPSQTPSPSFTNPPGAPYPANQPQSPGFPNNQTPTPFPTNQTPSPGFPNNQNPGPPYNQPGPPYNQPGPPFNQPPTTPYPENQPQYPNQQYPPYENSQAFNRPPYNQYDNQPPNYGYDNTQNVPNQIKSEPIVPNFPPAIKNEPNSQTGYDHSDYTQTNSFDQAQAPNGNYQSQYPFPPHLKTEQPLSSAGSNSPITSWPITEIKTEVDRLKAEDKMEKSESDGEVKIEDLDTKKLVTGEKDSKNDIKTELPNNKEMIKDSKNKDKRKEKAEVLKSDGSESEDELPRRGRPRGSKNKDKDGKNKEKKTKSKAKPRGRKDRKTSKDKTAEDKNESESEESEKEEKVSREEELANVKKAEEMTYDWATELLKDYIPGIIENSAKMELFFYLLNESIKLGDRILLFSQSLFTLNLIEDFLEKNYIPGTNRLWERNTNYYRLDGSTHALEREKLINEFNSNPHVYLFLVSTRAGSLGINLVGANRVIVFDASWNPCHDTQAVCRVYRYGQKKPCFVYRFVMDWCLEKKIYDRQINKQGMADRVVDECNPDAVLSMKEITNLCIDNDEKETEPKDLSEHKDKYLDMLMQGILIEHGRMLSKEPFQHESLLVDRKEKKLSSAEKRLAQRGYELEKKAALAPKPSTAYRTVRAADGSLVQRPVASVRPMQHAARWIPADVWRRQGMTAQEMTLPLDVVIPTNSAEKTNIVLKAGQRVMVLKSPKGIYMQLESGKIIAIKTSLKGLGGQKDGKDGQLGKKVMTGRPAAQLPGSLKNNSAITITSKTNSRPGFQRVLTRPGMMGQKMRPMMPGQKIAEIRNRLGEMRGYGMRPKLPQGRMLRPNLPGSVSITKITKKPDEGTKKMVIDGEAQVLDSDDEDNKDSSDKSKDTKASKSSSNSENEKSNEEQKNKDVPKHSKPLVLTTDEKLPSEDALDGKNVEEDNSKTDDAKTNEEEPEKKINPLKHYRHQRPHVKPPSESSLSQLERTASVLNKEGMPDFRKNLDDITQSYSPNPEERTVKSKKKKSPNKTEEPQERPASSMSHSVSSLLSSSKPRLDPQITAPVVPIGQNPLSHDMPHMGPKMGHPVLNAMSTAQDAKPGLQSPIPMNPATGQVYPPAGPEAYGQYPGYGMGYGAYPNAPYYGYGGAPFYPPYGAPPAAPVPPTAPGFTTPAPDAYPPPNPQW